MNYPKCDGLVFKDFDKKDNRKRELLPTSSSIRGKRKVGRPKKSIDLTGVQSVTKFFRPV